MYPLFAGIVALAAILTFSVQPMSAKMLLPVMGGTPAVWNTAMLFFQTLLLAGYLYAHLSVRWLGPRRQWLAHLLLLLTGTTLLPIAISHPGESWLADWPALWVLFTLLVTLGLPFLVVTSTTPLIQRWLAATDHPHARDPYHLYAASNAGSVIALLAYPFLVEPRLTLSTQSLVWLVGYVLLAGALLLAAWLMLSRSGGGVPDQGAVVTTAPPSLRERLRWTLYAFIPSSLLLSVTTVLTTDLAPMPLLWVVPLSLYLLSHVHAFARRRLVATHWWLRGAVFLLLPLVGAQAVGLHQPMGMMVGVHLTALAVFALAFHGLLADQRPRPTYLTEFYVWLAVGGAAGGLFNALVAPVAFDRLLEYPLVLLLAAASLAAPAWRDAGMRIALVLGFVTATLLLGLSLLVVIDPEPATAAFAAAVILLVLIGLGWLTQRHAAAARMLALTGCAVAVAGAAVGEADEIHAARSFYGTHKVLSAEEGAYHVLMHGNTAHGAQERDRRGPPQALAYYHESGPLGDIFAVARGRDPRADIGVVGLGSGSMAAYRQPYQRMIFYEIDQEVRRIAEDPGYFAFLERCGRGCDVRLDDGRLGLAKEPAGRFGLVVLDAYSSAAVPVHLLTLEALDTFMASLAEDGLLAFHVSNPYVDLARVIARLAAEREYVVRGQVHSLAAAAGTDQWVHESEWVVVAREPEHLGRIAGADAWGDVSPAPGRPWTDEFSPVWHAYLMP